MFYGNDCCEVRACSYINISKAELKEYARLLQALGQSIQAVFQNPFQDNIDKLIALLNNLQKFLSCLDLSPAQEKIGSSIIAKLFKIDCCTIDKLVKLITEIQAILVQYGSGCLGGGTIGPTGPQGPALALKVPKVLKDRLVLLVLKVLKVRLVLLVLKVLKVRLVLL
ncbi:collagen-like repeat preface domain-containing protein, partial [Bacillus mycoides]|uniref:collagen-like repeat preface domain-containing protein n=1 Tax=Bacillus mycoides TaxID=1405 RepID=UPI002111BF65